MSNKYVKRIENIPDVGKMSVLSSDAVSHLLPAGSYLTINDLEKIGEYAKENNMSSKIILIDNDDLKMEE